MWPVTFVSRILKITLALSLAQVPVAAYAASDSGSNKPSAQWGKDGWPSLPTTAVDQEWTGGDSKKRPRGPDGSPVHITSQRDASGRPIFISMDARGNVVEVVPKAQPTGSSFAESVEYKMPNLPPNREHFVPPGKVERALEKVVTPFVREKPVEKPEWGKGGWPSVPENLSSEMRWTGGTNGRAPVGPDGYSPVYFSGQNDANGRPIVYTKDERIGKIVEATIPKTPEGKTFAQTIQFTETRLTAMAPEGRVVPIDNPSNLRRYFRWTDHQTRETFARISEVITGKKAWQDMQRPNLQRSAAKTVEAMNALPVSALSFGLALGVSAAYTLQMHYPNNPLVWSKYFEQMTDPIGWISLTGFVIGMAPATAFLNSARGPKTFLGQVPIFVGGLALGTLIQTGIEVMARDEDVSACMGFTNRYKTGSFFDNSRQNPFKPHDELACDRAYAKFKSGELPAEMIMKAVPNIAAVALSGSIFYGVLYKLQNNAAAQRFITAVNTASQGTLWGKALRGAYVVGTSVLFLALASKPQELFSERWDKFILSSGGKEGPLYAKTVEKSEDDLFKTWEALRKSGWQDPDVLAEVSDVCFDEKRIGSKYFDCAKAKNLDFAGALGTHGDLQKKWRQTLLRPTLAAYQEWTTKVATFRELYKQAFDFYESAINKIIYTREHPNAPATDPNVFNEANLEIKTVSHILSESERAFVARLDIVESFDRFANVSTPLLQEFLATSMACGPEAEGQTPSYWWNGLRDFTYDQLNIKRTADAVIEDEQGIIFKSKGYKVIFHPPRITTPIPGTTDTICTKAHDAGWSPTSLPARFFWSVKDWLVPVPLNKFEIVADGKQYVGVLDYIRDHVRTNIVTPGGVSQFKSWWSDFVGRQNEALGKSMSEEFSKVIEGQFKNALKNQEYYACDQNPIVSGTRLERYIGKLRLPTDSCGAQRTHRLADGVMNNMRDQARLYIAMMLDLYVSNSGMLSNPLAGAVKPRYAQSVSEVENAVLMPAYRVLEAYDGFAFELTDGSDPAKAEAAGKKMTDALVKFLSLVVPEEASKQFGVAAETIKVKHTGKKVTLGERANMQVVMMGQLAKGLNSVLQEWQAYTQIAAMQ